jgi:copper chaperone CopZ
MRVEKSLKALEGVKDVEVDLGTGVATISTSKEIEDRLLKEAVEDAGYLLKGIER